MLFAYHVLLIGVTGCRRCRAVMGVLCPMSLGVISSYSTNDLCSKFACT
jgi:hypothetical protein